MGSMPTLRRGEKKNEEEVVTRVAALERRISVGRLRGATRGRGTSDEAPVNPVRYPTQTAPTSCCPHMRAAVAVGVQERPVPQSTPVDGPGTQ